MTEYSSAEDLLSGNELTEEDFTLPNGKIIRIKEISSYERQLAMKNTINGDGNADTGLIERRMIRYALVNPKLTEAQVEAWMKSTQFQVINALTKRINELAGTHEGADKSDVS